jgi:hypothetical protein
MKKLLCTVILTSLMPLYALAESTAPGGSDGCGLGWQVTDKKTWIGTTTRGTTNAFVPPTFGMTSGTIGCEQHPIAKNDQAAATYVATNFDALSVQMAEGHGEYIHGLAKAMGCDDSVVADFGNMTRTHYKTLMDQNTTSGAELFENVKSQVQKNAVLAGHCSV